MTLGGVAEVEVVSPGAFTTIQDYPGRVGYWAVGVPPCGPMDSLSFRLGNRLLGNDEGAAGIEMTLRGAALHFRGDAVICLAGATMEVHAEGGEVPSWWTPSLVSAGTTLRFGGVRGGGVRTYLLIRGGIDLPEVLGSRSTFTLGGFGGLEGRTLRRGDVLRSGDSVAGPPCAPLDRDLIPAFGREWQIGVLYGPHGAPDFFTPKDIEMLFSTSWEVHFNSARTGVRLVGPKPEWARTDGGEAGLHPSNIHDNAYAIGAIDFTGDMPVILGPDGPSLGGFVCPAVVVQAQLWKLGQLAPRDRVRFVPLSVEAAAAAELEQDELIRSLALPSDRKSFRPEAVTRLGEGVLLRREVAGPTEAVVRPAGDRYLLVEFGPNLLDLEQRLRVHALQTRLEEEGLHGVLDLTPGVRSLQIHFDGRSLPRSRLLERVEGALSELPPPDDLEVPTRTVHLPLSWEDPAVEETVRRYMSGVRADAPWCPSNVEFIRRINGLSSIDEVHRIVFEASYLVLGLGDVYLGAPVATPLDRRHRLVTTKYNPARTWTPPNVVGIGGAYLCIYGMEGPGGYQLFGRTLQMWNERETEEFEAGKPWLLRFFDQIRFFPVSAEELRSIREDFPEGRYRLRIEPGVFRLREYRKFLASISEEERVFRGLRDAAFEAERLRWKMAGEVGGTREPSPEKPNAA